MIFSFFAHLVDVLGPRDFSAAICMLLLEKSASRVIRQTPEEIQNSLSLPISVFQHVTHDLQAYVGSFIYFYAHVRPDQRFSLDRHRDIERVSRIVTHILDSKSSETIFLEATPYVMAMLKTPWLMLL